jgi:hypothetical protein
MVMLNTKPYTSEEAAAAMLMAKDVAYGKGQLTGRERDILKAVSQALAKPTYAYVNSDFMQAVNELAGFSEIKLQNTGDLSMKDMDAAGIPKVHSKRR